ncbi:MAG: hypothetical protein LBN99_04590 [Oscillospiraceae bacterium]|jgi:hypothetical protein|nr:hypothetical protein [Oscillospiraceae bacterium]
MSETTVNSKNFVGYEYKEVYAGRDFEGVYADGYPNFGWQLDGGSYGRLKFKRDRKIRNKAELSRLQREFEAIIRDIENLERSKTNGAQIAALTVGLIGTALVGGATFAFIYGEMIPLMIVLALPGFILWGLAYMLYNRFKAKKSAAAEPLIDKKYDEIYEVCAQAHTLLEV